MRRSFPPATGVARCAVLLPSVGLEQRRMIVGEAVHRVQEVDVVVALMQE